MAKMAIHSSHSDIAKRLKRAEGHLRTIIAMMSENRSCLEIAQQLHAVEKAVSAAKKLLVHDHIEHCLERAVKPASAGVSAALGEFKEIAKYL